MTIVVSVRVNDGLVLAADSATTFVDGDGRAVKVYNNANKIFNLVKVWPIGAMTYGAASIGTASIATLSKDFRELLTTHPDWKIDRATYTVEDVARLAKRFLFEETYRKIYPQGRPDFYLGYRVCGYSAGAALSEVWEVTLREDRCDDPVSIYAPDSFGVRWEGEREALDRLILGVGSNASAVMGGWGIDEEAAARAHSELIKGLAVNLHLPAMPIQDAIDLAAWLAETAAKFTRFSLGAATVGGPIEVATITKHEGFKWVSRKHYYSTEFNDEGFQ